jgi:hypothetical protein
MVRGNPHRDPRQPGKRHSQEIAVMREGLDNINSLTPQQEPQPPETADQSPDLAQIASTGFVSLKIVNGKIGRLPPFFKETLLVIKKRDNHLTTI